VGFLVFSSASPKARRTWTPGFPYLVFLSRVPIAPSDHFEARAVLGENDVQLIAVGLFLAAAFGAVPVAVRQPGPTREGRQRRGSNAIAPGRPGCAGAREYSPDQRTPSARA
jgi:hypothetical protein